MARAKLAFIDTQWSRTEYSKKTGKWGAIAYYRLYKPAEILRKWFDVDVFGKNIQELGNHEQQLVQITKEYDLIYSKHIDTGRAASNLLALADHFKKPVVIDIDDDYLHIRKSNPAFEQYAEMKGGRYFLSSLLNLATGITVSTQPLKDIYTQFNFNIDLLPNCNDVADWQFKKRVFKDDFIRIGYMGSITHNEDMALILEPVAKIMEKYPKVLFQLCGAVGPDDFPKLAKRMQSFVTTNILDRIRLFMGTPSWEGFPRLMSLLSWDIGLAPLIDDHFNHGKSHIKWFDYSMVGTTTIASKVYPFYNDIDGVHTIQDRKTGILVEKNDQWFEKLEELVLKPQLRRELADKAYLYIKDNWQWTQWAPKWKKTFEKYLK